MLLHVNVADDVVVDQSVLSWAEVPGLFLWIVGTVLEALQLVIEVEDVVRLLVPESTILFKEKVA